MDAVYFLLSWVAVYVGFFSLAQTKLPNYILPAYPPMALLTARFLVRWQAGAVAIPRWVWPLSLASLGFMGGGVVIGLLIAGGVLTVPAFDVRPVAGLGRWAWIGVIPILGAVGAAWCLRQNCRGRLVTALTLTAVIFVGLAGALPLGAVDACKACRPLVAAAGAFRPKDEIRIACLSYFQPSLVFYCGREVSDVYSPDQAMDLLRGSLPAYVFCPADIGEALAGRGHYRVTGRHSDLYRGIDVVVVTNQR